MAVIIIWLIEIGVKLILLKLGIVKLIMLMAGLFLFLGCQVLGKQVIMLELLGQSSKLIRKMLLWLGQSGVSLLIMIWNIVHQVIMILSISRFLDVINFLMLIAMDLGSFLSQGLFLI